MRRPDTRQHLRGALRGQPQAFARRTVLAQHQVQGGVGQRLGPEQHVVARPIAVAPLEQLLRNLALPQPPEFFTFTGWLNRTSAALRNTARY